MLNPSIPASVANERSWLLGLAAAFLAFPLILLPYLVTGSVGVYQVVYPAVAVVLAVALYAASRPVYVGFSLWMWLLTPLVRRLVDYGIGAYTPDSLVMTAPYLVGGVGVIGLWSVLTEEVQGVRQAFAFPVLALLYGVSVGVVLNGITRVPKDFLEWGIPLVTSALILADWRQYLRYRAVVLRTITLGMGLLGLYGLYQFFVLPPWDRMWMEGVDDVMINIGRPLPLEVRLFGTMHSPNPYGVTLAVGLLGLLATGVRSRREALLARLAAIPAAAALAISTVRTGWGACVVGLLYVLITTRSRGRRQVVFFGALLLAAVGAAMLFSPVAELVSERAATFTDLSSNRSFNSRTEMYAMALPEILRNPVGWGLGNPYPADSGVIRTLVSLGWVGTVCYVLGLGLLFLWAWRLKGQVPAHDMFVPVAMGMAVAIVSVLPLGVGFEDFYGVFLWGFLALSIAGIRYHRTVAHAAPAPSAPGPASEQVPAAVSN